MKTVPHLLVASVLWIATPSWAAPQSNIDGEPAGEAEPPMSAPFQAVDNNGEIRGTVTEIDRSTGMVTVQTNHGDVRMPMQRDNVRDLNEGAQVTARLSLSPHIAAGDAPADVPGSEQTLTGTVTAIDHDSGFVTIKTARTSMSLPFPAVSLEHLKTGDSVAVGLTLQP